MAWKAAAVLGATAVFALLSGCAPSSEQGAGFARKGRQADAAREEAPAPDEKEETKPAKSPKKSPKFQSASFLNEGRNA